MSCKTNMSNLFNLVFRLIMLTFVLRLVQLSESDFQTDPGSKRFLVSEPNIYWTSTLQYVACSLTHVQGYEKLTDACCRTGLDVICANLPWNRLMKYLGSCLDTTTKPPTALVNETCMDTIDNCALYGKQACSVPVYRPWAKIHCSAFCEFCIPVTLKPFVCKDKLANCREFDSGDLCTADSYFAWSRENCYAYCGYAPCNNFQTDPGSKRFLVSEPNVCFNTTEQFTSCSLTCVPGYEKLTDVCCKTGVDIVCSNLPWDLLLPQVANCSVHLQSDLRDWTSTLQYAACSLTHVQGYEKLTDACCRTGLDVICANLPWNRLMKYLGSCLDTTMITPTASVSVNECVDTVDNCASYGRIPCTEPLYKPWAKAHCSLFCGLCTPVTMTPFVCKDKLPNCREYDSGNLCTEMSYFAWAHENCYAYCGFAPCATSTTASATNTINVFSSTSIDALATTTINQDHTTTRSEHTTMPVQ